MPAGHEDHPERAVRAGLRIVEAAERTGGGWGPPRFVLRVGINTGEALVRLGVSPGSGEGFLTGRCDQHRLAAAKYRSGDGRCGRPAHLRGAAPVSDYLTLKPATLKGKAEPVRVFPAPDSPSPGRD